MKENITQYQTNYMILLLKTLRMKESRDKLKHRLKLGVQKLQIEKLERVRRLSISPSLVNLRDELEFVNLQKLKLVR